MITNRVKYAAISSLYLWVGLFILLPLLSILVVSFLSISDEALFSLPFNFSNYNHLISPLFLHVFLRSLCMATITSFICLCIAYPFSYLLAKTKQRKLLILFVLIPFWTSSLVRSYALIGLLKYKGLLNAGLLYVGLIHQPLELLYTNTAVVIGLSYNLLPFMILPLYNHFEQFDMRLVHAAKDLGASHRYIFRYILLPLSLPAISSGLMMTLLPAMTLFYIASILGGAKSLLLGNYIEGLFLFSHQWPQGAASSVVLSIILTLLLVFSRTKRRRVRS